MDVIAAGHSKQGKQLASTHMQMPHGGHITLSSAAAVTLSCAPAVLKPVVSSTCLILSPDVVSLCCKGAGSR